jgi:membrane protein DedA with SNARE-associated domain
LLEQFVDDALRFITENRFWAGPLIALLAFAESMAFLSFVVPFTGIIIGAGTLVGSGALDPWIVIPWGIAGASLGDALSYWIGRYFDKAVPKIWPFKNNPEMLERGYRFFERWGTLSVFLGRFFGPLRAVVPIVAGMMAMPHLKFQIANVTSAILWLPLLLSPGALVGSYFAELEGLTAQFTIYVLIFFFAMSVVMILIALLRRGKRGNGPRK